MTSEEVSRFLAEQPILIAATLGPDGWPHLMPLWYVLRGSEPWIFTYAKSQKVRNLERDPRATLLVEAGQKDEEVRGVMLTAQAKVHRERDTVAEVAQELFARYGRDGSTDGPLGDRTREAVRTQIPKRVAVQFRIDRTVSWDHSKLAGGY